MKRSFADVLTSVPTLGRDELIELVHEARDALSLDGYGVMAKVPDELWLSVLHNVMCTPVRETKYHGWLFCVATVSKQMAHVSSTLIKELFKGNPGTSLRVMRHLRNCAIGLRLHKKQPKEKLAFLPKMTALNALTLMCTDITDSALSRCTALTSLKLCGESISNAESLNRLTSLRVLVDWRWYRHHLSDQYDLSYLVRMPHLTSLNLDNLSDPPSRLPALHLFQNLTALALPARKPTLNGFSYTSISFAISTLTNLRSLAPTCYFDDDTLSQISHMTWLTELDLSHGGIACTILKDDQLRQLTNLRILSLVSNREITDDGVSSLTGLQELYCSRESLLSSASVSSLTQLRVLVMPNINDRGSIEHYSGLTALEVLDCCRDDNFCDVTGANFVLLTRLCVLRANLMEGASCLLHLTRLQSLGTGNWIEHASRKTPVVTGCRTMSYDGHPAFCYTFDHAHVSQALYTGHDVLNDYVESEVIDRAYKFST